MALKPNPSDLIFLQCFDTVGCVIIVMSLYGEVVFAVPLILVCESYLSCVVCVTPVNVCHLASVTCVMARLVTIQSVRLCI